MTNQLCVGLKTKFFNRILEEMSTFDEKKSKLCIIVMVTILLYIWRIDMPLQKVRKGNQTCWKFGKDGKVYCGPGAKEKAARQGRAIKAQQTKSRKSTLIEQILEILSNTENI